MEADYIKILRKGTSQYRVQKVVLYFIIIAVFIGFLLAAFNGVLKENIVMIIIIYAFLGFYYWKNRTDFKPFKYWQDQFEKTPKNIIWIKPITIEHTAYFVFTYSKSYKYEVLLKNGLKMTLMCPEEKKELFKKMIAQYAPHAHFGYSKEVEKLYRKDKENFLRNLTKKDLFHGASEFI